MTTRSVERTATDERAMRVAVTLFAGALVAVLVAAIAGITLMITEPEAGSTAEAALGITAAVAGLSTAAFVVAGLVYTQVKNLWRFMPTWLRMAFWVIIAIGVAITVWNLITQAT